MAIGRRGGSRGRVRPDRVDRQRIFHAANAGWGWGHNEALPDQNSRTMAALAGLDGVLHMVYVAKNSPTVWHTTRTRWGEWKQPVQIPGLETSRTPGLTAANGRLFCVVADGNKRLGESAQLLYLEFDGDEWSTPAPIEGYVCYGEPVAVTEPGLPQQIHLLLPSRTGVLHMWTEDEVSLAPVKPKVMKRVK